MAWLLMPTIDFYGAMAANDCRPSVCETQSCRSVGNCVGMSAARRFRRPSTPIMTMSMSTHVAACTCLCCADALPEFLEVFDFPDPSLVVGSRNVSTVSQQALLLMNHPFVRGQAEAAARRLLAAGLADDDGRVQHAFRQVLGRVPLTAERDVINQLLTATGAGTPREQVWANVYQLLFSSLDFRYRD